MRISDTGTPFGMLLAAAMAGLVTLYFGLSALQGDHGMFRRLQTQSELAILETRKAELEAELAALSNLTTRLSDTSLDLDLLDERARVVLGYLRADEVVIQ
jgi:cell division protein FtsB